MYCNKCGALLSNGTNYCHQCGSYIPSMQNKYGHINTSNENSRRAESSIIDNLKKIRVITLLGVFCPIIINFAVFTAILIIFVQGPLGGELDNMNYISSYELKEFAITYGFIYVFTLILNVATFIIMLSNFSKFSKIQESFHKNYDLNALTENLNKFSNISIIIITVIDAVLLGFIFAIPQIVFCVIINTGLNEVKRNIRLLSTGIKN